MKAEKTNIIEKQSISFSFSVSYRVLFILDGHGVSTDKEIVLKNSCRFLTSKGTTLSSEEFNNFLKDLCYSPINTNNVEGFKLIDEHILFPLKGSQKLNGYTIQKIIKDNGIPGYSITSLVNNFDVNSRQCTLKFLYTNFHPETKCRLVQLRVDGTEEKQISLSEIEEFIVPWFTKISNENEIENLIWESCGFTNDLSTEIPVEYIWGACR